MQVNRTFFSSTFGSHPSLSYQPCAAAAFDLRGLDLPGPDGCGTGEGKVQGDLLAELSSEVDVHC